MRTRIGLVLALSLVFLLVWLPPVVGQIPRDPNRVPKPKPTPAPTPNIAQGKRARNNRPPRPKPKATPKPSPTPTIIQTFEFETVRLDRDGKEVERRKLQRRYFTEDLGKGVKLDMVEIPGDTFLMGSPASEDQHDSYEGPQRLVNVPSFWMGKFEVTQQQWLAVMEKFINEPRFRGNDLPVENVSWHGAQKFLEKLNKLPYLKGKNYRLPTEAEWEYAARAGTTTPFAFGETVTPQIVNYNGNHFYANAPKGEYREKTTPGGFFKVANPFGLFDMHGNVWEWCQDYWHENYNGAPSDGSAWLGGGNLNLRILRSGSWGYYGSGCRSALRNKVEPSYFDQYIGFRVVCESVGMLTRKKGVITG